MKTTDNETNPTTPQPDIGPGDAVAGAADYPTLREAIHKMAGLYEIGDRSAFAACPQSAFLAIAFLLDCEARNCPAPKLLVDDCDIVLTWEVGGWKLYQYCDAEESISFRWIGAPIAAQPEPVAGAAGPFRASPRDWTEDFAHENGNYMCRCFHLWRAILRPQAPGEMPGLRPARAGCRGRAGRRQP